MQRQLDSLLNFRKNAKISKRLLLTSICEDEQLKLAINLSFSCSLRLGELLGLTWDCVDISPEAIEENRAYVFINKESQRIRKESLNALDGKDVLLVFLSVMEQSVVL